MPPKARNATVKASEAPESEQAKIKPTAAAKQAPTAASSRPRRVAKPINNETTDVPDSTSRAPKRKRPVGEWEAVEQEAKKKGNTKKHSGEMKTGEMSVRTDYDGHEEANVKHDAAVDITRKLHRGRNFWLMKAEPLSRMEKGKDVKFSIDDLKAAKEPEGWDGNTHHLELIDLSLTEYLRRPKLGCKEQYASDERGRPRFLLPL